MDYAMVNRTDRRARTLIAQEAARIILDEGIQDYHLAKRRAMARMGISERGGLPRNTEIEQAIREHQELFFTEDDHRHRHALWRAALAAMRLLQAYSPRLVGPVLNGTAGRHSAVTLHVFSDSVEEILFRLMDARIAYRSTERRLRVGKETRPYPCLCFITADIEVEAIVMPGKELRQSPFSAIDGKPMRRAEIREVTRRLAALGTR
jgi:hypothetical protein